jgi:hypothetical protein
LVRNDQVSRNVVKKTGWLSVPVLTEERTACSMYEIESTHGTGKTNVGQTALLF